MKDNVKKKGIKRKELSIHFSTLFPYACAFLIPIFIMLGVFMERGIFPFGEQSFLRTDLYHQYAPFFQSLKEKFETGGSLFYSWDIGLGTNYSALLAYYLASPMNWLLYLCPADYVIEFITYFIVFKIALSSVTFTYYMNKHMEMQNKLSQSTSSLSSTIIPAFFGIFYGLSGYMAAYSWNIMWLDCILLFPLIILGIEKLIKQDKCLLYCITLALSILSNYYISIMICMFLVVYFLLQLILLPAKVKKTFTFDNGDSIEMVVKTKYVKKLFHFAMYSLLAGGLAAIVLLPEVYALQMTASSDFSFPKTITSYFSMFDMIARHLVAVDTHIGLDHWPNIYCGVGILFLLPLYVLNKKINYKEKIIYFFLLVFFYLGFSLNILNFIWHGLHYPNSLPARQSFIYIFIILVMAYKGLIGLKERSIKQLTASIWIAVGFIIIAEHIITEDFFHWYSFYLSLLFVCLYGLFAYLFRRKKLPSDIVCIIIFSLIAIESAINTSETSVTTVNRTSYKQYDTAISSLLEQVEQIEGNNFYRVEKFDRRTKNDGAWYKFHSASVFSSTANANITDFYKKLGLEGSTNAYSMNGSTLFTDSLFNIKYMLSSKELHNGELQQLQTVEDGVFLYNNPYALSLGFVTDSNLDINWNGTWINPIDNQNDFIKQATGISNTFESIASLTTDNHITTITVEEDGYIYGYVNNTGSKKVKKVTASCGDFTETYDNIDRGYLLNLGYREAGDVITITASSDTDLEAILNVSAYRLNEERYVDAMKELGKYPMVIDSYTDTSINAHFTAPDTALLVTTIPYEDGWTITLDGKKVEPETFENTFISLLVTEGSHTISFTYTPSGFSLGTMVTGGSLIALILLLFVTNKWNQFQVKKEEEKVYELYYEQENKSSSKEKLNLNKAELDEDFEQISIPKEAVMDSMTTMNSMNTMEKEEQED